MKRAGSPPISYREYPSMNAEQARDARARAWIHVFECWNRKKAAEHAPEPDGRNDAKEIENGCAAESEYSR